MPVVTYAPNAVNPACAQKVGCTQLKTVTENVGSIPGVVRVMFASHRSSDSVSAFGRA